jgi:hypothetical protein
MADLKLKYWFEMINPFALMALTSGSIVRTSSALQPVVDAFTSNCDRIFFAQRLPQSLFGFGRIFQIAESLASNELEGDPFKYAAQHKTWPSAQVTALRDQYVANQKPMSIVPAALTSHEDLQHALDRHGAATEIELIMSMQLTFAWTIAETLLGDLLKVVIDGPSKRLNAKGKPLCASNYYLARFRGDKSLQTGYTDTFHVDGIDINKVVSDDSLLALFAVRNVITHKAGICDNRYEEYMKVLPRIPQLKIGERLVLDGKIMSELVVPAMDCCLALIQHVDVWLADHP